MKRSGSPPCSESPQRAVRTRSTPQTAALCGLVALACWLLPAAALADGEWSGSLALVAVGQDVSGSEDAYLTQINLDEGISLQELLLRYRGSGGKPTAFRLEATGFGDAEPSQRLGLELDLASPWRFELGYDRRESFFGLREWEEDRRRDDWRIERWHLGAVWDGFKPARIGLDFRTHERSGSVVRPIFGLNELYPLAVDLDESMEELALSLETRNLPVHLYFEQSFATYERRNDRQPAGDTNLDGDDADLFVLADDSRDEQRDVPTTRLTATYQSPRWEAVGSLLYRPADLDSSGPVSSGFDIAGGQAGQVEFIDDFISSAEMDSLVGNLRLGIRLAPHWKLRLDADYRDTSTAATLLGERLLRLTNPFGGQIEIAGAVDETTLFDVTEDQQRLTVEWSDRGWTVWGGGMIASRDVSWRRTNSDPGLDVTRDSDGFLFGAAWRSSGFSGSAEYESGSFDRFVFRTDPESVDRLTFRLKAALGDGGWHLRARGRFEEADNPPAESDLDRSAESWGAGLGWSSEDGAAGFGVDLDLTDLATETDLVLPDGTPDVSIYDLSLTTVTAHGRGEVGRAGLNGALTRIEDSGDTWPVESWLARVGVDFEVRSNLEILAFGEYWSYDEERANGDDYDVTRYGLGFRWRFQ